MNLLLTDQDLAFQGTGEGGQGGLALPYKYKVIAWSSKILQGEQGSISCSCFPRQVPLLCEAEVLGPIILNLVLQPNRGADPSKYLLTLVAFKQPLVICCENTFERWLNFNPMQVSVATVSYWGNQLNAVSFTDFSMAIKNLR